MARSLTRAAKLCRRAVSESSDHVRAIKQFIIGPLAGDRPSALPPRTAILSSIDSVKTWKEIDAERFVASVMATTSSKNTSLVSVVRSPSQVSQTTSRRLAEDQHCRFQEQ
jgi:hypothetical protein